MIEAIGSDEKLRGLASALELHRIASGVYCAVPVPVEMCWLVGTGTGIDANGRKSKYMH